MLPDKYNCCGCSACYSVCPKGCISMLQDEKGFLNPVIDQENCVHCGLCESVCSVLHFEKYNKNQINRTFAIQNVDEGILFESTSGGLFSAIAKLIISRGGVVFGGIIDDELKVYHIKGVTLEDLIRFRGSKYVQSAIKNTFKEAKHELEQGREVLFSGTPCQIAGLKNYLGKEYQNLYTIDVVCHAVPSPLLFSKYIEYKKKKYKDIRDFKFRDKERGYDYSTLSFHYTRVDGKEGIYRRGSESDEWMRLFLGNDSSRDSCTKCKFQTKESFSDLTIADLFNPLKYSKKLTSKQGYTRTYVNSEKGMQLVKSVSDICIMHEIEMPRVDRGEATKSKKNLEGYWKDVANMDNDEFFRKHYPIGIKQLFLSSARIIMYRIGIYSIVKKIINR